MYFSFVVSSWAASINRINLHVACAHLLLHILICAICRMQLTECNKQMSFFFCCFVEWMRLRATTTKIEIETVQCNGNNNKIAGNLNWFWRMCVLLINDWNYASLWNELTAVNLMIIEVDGQQFQFNMCKTSFWPIQFLMLSDSQNRFWFQSVQLCKSNDSNA